jgi:hypothetical protein
VRIGPVILLLAASLQTAACGGEPLVEQRTSSETTERRVTPRQPDTPTAPQRAPQTAPAQTRQSRERLIYSDARTLCERFGVRRVVRTFRVRGGGAREVARALARENYSRRLQDVAFRGCLAGFAER